jgi:Domain of unknown function (DUF5668)
MDCVNHPGVSAAAYCQNCGKPLCSGCVASSAMRPASRGLIACSNCIDAWQAASPFVPPAYVPPPPRPHGVPHPAAAAVLGLIPGVGAMYNGQFFKGLIHVVIFAVLVSMTDHYPIFGIFIAAWILYQSFEAYHTARARLEGQPSPDPLGINELGNWLNLGSRPYAPAAATEMGAANASPSVAGSGSNPGPEPGFAQQAYSGPAPGAQAAYPPPPPYGPPPPGFGPVPPPPYHWRRREPVGAIVLIALGVLFLAGQLDWLSGRVFDFTWPALLIGLGVWLIVRHLSSSQGGPK